MKKLLYVFCFFVFCLSLNAGASVINLCDSFPDSQSENNFYAYGFNVNTAVYRLLQDTGEDSFSTPDQQFSVPTVNLAAGSLEEGYPWIFLHPTYSCGTIYGVEDAVLGWQAPEEGLVDLNLIFWLKGSISSGINVYVKKNKETIVSANLYSSSNTITFTNGDIAVHTGDFLYFGINALGNDTSDWGNLKGSFDFNIPEPATVALLGLGVLSLVIRKK